MKSIKEIAVDLDCSKSAIFQHIRRFKKRGISLAKFATKYHNTLFFNATGVYLIELSFRAKNSKAKTVKDLVSRNKKLQNQLNKSKTQFNKLNNKLNALLNMVSGINSKLSKRPSHHHNKVLSVLRRAFK